MDRNSSSAVTIVEIQVAPRRGAWIEIRELLMDANSNVRRTPQGCVDRNIKTKQNLPMASWSHPAGVRG